LNCSTKDPLGADAVYAGADTGAFAGADAGAALGAACFNSCTICFYTGPPAPFVFSSLAMRVSNFDRSCSWLFCP